eukprot:715060-Prorocentrum_minimum.AAC.1
MEALQRLQKVRPRAALHHNGGLHRVLHQLAQVRVHRVEHLALLRELLADVLALSEDGFQVRPLLQQVGPHAHHRVRVRQPLLPHRQLRVKVACVPAGAHGLQLNDVVVQHFAHRLRRRRLQHGHSKAQLRKGGEDIPAGRPQTRTPRPASCRRCFGCPSRWPPLLRSTRLAHRRCRPRSPARCRSAPPVGRRRGRGRQGGGRGRGPPPAAVASAAPARRRRDVSVTLTRCHVSLGVT